MTYPDGNLRTSPVTVSVLNPQTNQYQQIGKTLVLAVRKSNNILVLILGPNRKAISMTQATPQIDWVIQSETYSSFVDSRNMRYLLLFESKEECQIFTAIALSAKLEAGNAPIVIAKGKSGQKINSGERYLVNYKCFDLGVPKIEAPIMEERNFEFLESDSTPLTAIIRNGDYGDLFLVKFSDKVIAIVESIDKKQELPQNGLPSVSQNDEKVKKPKEDKVEKQKENVEIVKEEKTVPVKEIKDDQKLIQNTQENVQQINTTTAPQQQLYDSQLESIKNEMESKFRELTQMISSLRRTQVSYSNVPLSSDILVSSVQRLLKENQIKDELIKEKQQLIDLLKERNSDTRERDALRIQLAGLSSKLSAQRQLTQTKIQQQIDLNKQIDELKEKIAKAKIDAENHLTALHQELENEKQKQFEELESQKKQLEWKVKSAEDDVSKIRAEYKRACEENKILKEQASKDVSAELEKMKKAVPILVQRTVKQMVSGVYQLIQDNFDDDTEYDGVMIMKAIKTALQTQANEIFEQIDPEEEDEDDE